MDASTWHDVALRWCGAWAAETLASGEDGADMIVAVATLPAPVEGMLGAAHRVVVEHLGALREVARWRAAGAGEDFEEARSVELEVRWRLADLFSPTREAA